MTPPHRWFRFSLRTLFVLVTLGCLWLGGQLHWIRQRHQALEWLEGSKESWYSPCIEGATLEASAPWSLRLFGERAVVGIGMDREEFAGPTPYSPSELKRLFPEAQVKFSRNGSHESLP